MYVCGLTEINMAKTMIKSNYNLFLWASLVVGPQEMNYNLLQLRRLKVGANFLAKAIHSPTY